VVNDRLRIGDAERETAARELGEHFAMGRITVDEHTERLEQIWSARTEADLAPAFQDLPRPRAATQPARPDRAARQATTSASTVRRGWDRRPQAPRIPFPFKVLVAIVLIWWGFHHPLFLLIAAIVYVVLIRRFIRRRRWHGRSGSWHDRYQAGWH
jgi:Flp pilus assembly protein TadB